MESDQIQLFNQKLNQWIASQGFWFQLRHSMLTGGSWKATLLHVARLGMNLTILALVLITATGIYLVKRVESPKFLEWMDQGLAAGMSGSDAKILELRRDKGDALVRRIGVEGGENSFFRSLDAGNIRFKMPILVGLGSHWNAGTLQAKWLDLDVKAGADSQDHAEQLEAALFRTWPGFQFSSVEVDDATFRWGYTDKVAGKIENSRLMATRVPDGWRLSLTGGTFSQNWVRNLPITRMVIEVNRTGLKVTEGRLKAGSDGEVILKDVAVEGGVKPQLQGSFDFDKADVGMLLPDSAKPFASGKVTGNFVVSGSTNGLEGIRFAGKVEVSKTSPIQLGDGVHLLGALSLADPFNRYRRVEFNQGRFQISTGDGSMKLTDVDLTSEALMTMRGAFEVRLPTEVEVAGAGRTGIGGGIVPTPEETRDLTVKRAAQTRTRDGQQSEIFDRRDDERINKQLEQEEFARRSRDLRAAGKVTVTIPGTAFDRSALLRDIYPIDPASGRIVLDVPLTGRLIDITRRQAEEISRLAEERNNSSNR